MITRLTRRQFLQSALTLLAAGSSLNATGKPSSSLPPNVLMVVFDDLNDWINCLGGYPGTVHTPNLDALAQRGTLIANAHCAIPLCNGSRTSTLTGLSPLQTGVFYNNTQWRRMPALRNTLSLPQRFRRAGYHCLNAGKVFHFPDPASWDRFWPDNLHGFPDEPVPPDNEHPLKGGPPQNRIDASFDWGVVNTPTEQTPDYQVADHIIRYLDTPSTQPVFIGMGLGKPHLPWYLPQRYFDAYPLDAVQLPAVLDHDLDDVPAAARALVNDYLHKDVVRFGFWKKAVQAYLASITYADEQLGRVLTALNQSSRADNTLVVVWSDHGWHLGEKMQWRKLTLWNEATHVPLIMSGPGIQAGQRVDAAVSLLDIVPTLGELCHLPLPATLAGRSLVPLLHNAHAPGAWSAATVWEMQGKIHASLREGQYRYTRYADGSEELYDMAHDPHEWHNLAALADRANIKAQLQHTLRQQQEAMQRAIPSG